MASCAGAVDNGHPWLYIARVSTTEKGTRGASRNSFRSRARTLGLVALTLSVVTAAAAFPAGAAASSHSGSLRFKGAPRAKSAGNLVDRGGPVLSSSHTYAIFWGPSGAWSSDVQSGLASLFGGFGGSNYLGIAGQYMRGATIGSTYSGSMSDTSAPPKQVSASMLGAEVQKLYRSIDPAGIYFVYTSNFPSGGAFCAWHSFATVNGQDVPVAYMPNTTGVAGCDPGNPYNLTGSQGLRSLASVTAHEFMESVTDPLPGGATYAWIDRSGSEIGDKCAWQFGGPVTLSNNSHWQLQEEWSNDANGAGKTGACVQGP